MSDSGKDYNLMNDSAEGATLNNRTDLKKSIFQAGDNLYRSVYNKPMQSSMWLCCKKIEKAPLLILLILTVMDVVRYTIFTILGHSTGMINLMSISNAIPLILCIVGLILMFGVRNQRLTGWFMRCYSVIRV